MAVNGATVIDENETTDPTHNTSMMGTNDELVNRIMIVQDYSGGTYDQKPAYQWITGLQIWDGLPPSTASAAGALSTLSSAPSIAPSAPTSASSTKSRPNTYTPVCRRGLWRYPNGSQASGVACLQPNGTWRMVAQ